MVICRGGKIVILHERELESMYKLALDGMEQMRGETKPKSAGKTRKKRS
jgi:hypothetical protein